MTVHFIGAGPGAPDLITLRGINIIKKCRLCLYAGSLIPKDILNYTPENACIKDTAPMVLNDIIDEIKKAHQKGWDVARLHSGDPSLYGATAEQMRQLDKLNIPYDVTPGVPAYAAAAAALKQELTLPEIAQTLILTRTTMKASAMPEKENLENLAKTHATLAIHLSIRNLNHICKTLIPHYGATCPVAIVTRASWPDQHILIGTLSNIKTKVRQEKITRTALILVGRVLNEKNYIDSALYNPQHQHILRNKKTKKIAHK